MSQAAKQGGLLAVDCVVICCCCPCIVLQVTLFLFIRLPHKLAVKSKRIILKKIHKRLRKRVDGDNKNDAVVNGEDNKCFWMEFDNVPERSKPLQSELQGFPTIHESGRVLLFGSEEGNDELDAWITQDRKVFFDGSTWLGDEKEWKELLDRGVFWFGSFWGNGDYLGSIPEPTWNAVEQEDHNDWT